VAACICGDDGLTLQTGAKCHLLSHSLRSLREDEREPQRVQPFSVLLQESVDTRCGAVNQTITLFPSCHWCEYVPLPHQSIVSLSSAALTPLRCLIVIWSHVLWSRHGLSDLGQSSPRGNPKCSAVKNVANSCKEASSSGVHSANAFKLA